MEVSLSDLYSNVTYQLEDREISSSDNSLDNSISNTFRASTPSPKRRRATHKKVVTCPANEIEGSRFKGDCTPPSDSWSWRKYGQKPIKGSPYPRGYYRCSSSKGCPARKQVERSRLDPKTLLVTYSYDHNHPLPISRNNRHNTTAATTSTPPTLTSTTTDVVSSTVNSTYSSLGMPSMTTLDKIKVGTKSQAKMESHTEQTVSQQHVITPTPTSHKTILLQQSIDQHEPLIAPGDELMWLSSEHHILKSNSLFSNFSDLELNKFFPMREEDESLFADLGELPECSMVFRRVAGVVAGEEGSLAPATTWCGTMG